MQQEAGENCSDEGHNFYCASNNKMIKSRIIIWVRHIARMGKNINIYKALVAKPEGKR
jgi:hypothetical protein